MRLITEDQPATADLRGRLDQYYSTAVDYIAFNQPSDVRYFWRHLLPAVRAVVVRRGTCRILEFGAGRSGLGEFLHEEAVRGEVHLTLHDVMSANIDWLIQEADEVKIGPVPRIDGEYDIIVSSFVLEHMTDPRASMEVLWSALAPGGSLFIVCPCYDWPFYLPPACDHLGLLRRAAVGVRVVAARVGTVFTNRPAFLLLSDAALFHLPFRKDRDAVHLASWIDLRRYFLGQGATVTRLRFDWVKQWQELLTPGGLKAWFISRVVMVGFAATKPV